MRRIVDHRRIERAASLGIVMDTHHEIEKLKQASRAALISGSAASAISATALALGGALEERSAAGPLNGPSQWLWGEEEAYTREPTLKHTALGYAIHHGSSLMWATMYERLFSQGRSQKRTARILAEAAGATAIAYFVDYYLTPKRFRPGFRKHLSDRSIFAVYAGFAAGLAACSLLARRRAQAASSACAPMEHSQ
jgi:hypothetical protein